MQIKYLENGEMELTNLNGTIILNEEDVWILYHDMKRWRMRKSLIDAIKNFDDWCFEQT